MTGFAAEPAVHVFGFIVCALAFTVAALHAATSRLADLRKASMVAGCVATAAWAAAAAASSPMGRMAGALFILRAIAWIAFLAATLRIDRLPGARLPRRVRLGAAIFLAAALGAAVDMASIGPAEALAPWAATYLQLFLSIAGLLLLENLFRNCDDDSLWGVKWICLGLGVVFVYDFYICADAALTRHADPGLWAALGFIDALAVPLLMAATARSGSWHGDISLSRSAVFHSAVLLGSGFYLLLMSAVGTFLRSVGGGWGPVLQSLFLAVAVLTMLVAISSGSFRSNLRVFISKHFFRHKYDYRDVWLTFIRRLSASEEGGTLQSRVLHAVADIFDCPAGALWELRRPEGALFPAAAWNFGADPPVEAADGGLSRFLAERGDIIDVEACRRSPECYPGFDLPSWLAAHPRAWIIVPLIHNRRLEAFLVLGRPRSSASLGWEETDLLKTVGAQAASYLAEENTSRALADARRLEEFNQRFAFVIHDIKNVVSQMSLMVDNARVHGGNPQFQRDMLTTVSSSVERLRGMLTQLAAGRQAPSDAPKVADLTPLLRGVAERWRNNGCRVTTRGLDGQIPALINEQALVSVLDHLLQNAAEACGGRPEAALELALREEAETVVIDVRDRGPGMDAAFVRDKLFKLLDSGKTGGLGLGAYQARQLIRAMGGRLEVDSRPGYGTTMRLHLQPEPGGPRCSDEQWAPGGADIPATGGPATLPTNLGAAV